jgi:endonuclease YncB( thermonuclease family)
MGLAREREYPPDLRYASVLEAAESEAREAERGIWADE